MTESSFFNEESVKAHGGDHNKVFSSFYLILFFAGQLENNFINQYGGMVQGSVAGYLANMKLNTERDLHNLHKRWQILQDILSKDKGTYDRQLSSFGELTLLLPLIICPPI